MNRALCFSVVLAAIWSLTGCVTRPNSYYDNAVSGSLNMHKIARSDIHIHSVKRNPAIFIHGLMGSVLSKKKSAPDSPGEVVWGRFIYKDMADQSLFWKIALPIFNKNSNALPQLEASCILNASEIKVGGVSYEIGNYRYIIDLLHSIGYRSESAPSNGGECRCANLFIFKYDWRRSIAENAALLNDFIAERKAHLADLARRNNHKTDPDMRFDLIGHSMGGLIARYYAMYGAAPLGCKNAPLPELKWAGAKNISKVITIATPNSGYADSFYELVNGLKLAELAPLFPAGVWGTFPSCYQMMPDSHSNSVIWKRSGKPVDIYDIELWKKYRWGVLADSKDNQRLFNKFMKDLSYEQQKDYALDHLEKMLDSAVRLKVVLNRPMGIPPEPLRFYGFASAGVLTNTVLTVDEDSGKVEVFRKAPGDGKVSLHSSLAECDNHPCPVYWHSTYILDGAHMGIMRSELFIRNLARLLVCE